MPRSDSKTSWKKISTLWQNVNNETISQEAISSCLTRSALSRKWKKGENLGKFTYLCNADLVSLDNEIKERAQVSHALDTVSITDEAAKLKTTRINKGAEFLRLIKCPQLAAKLDNIEIVPPSRP